MAHRILAFLFVFSFVATVDAQNERDIAVRKDKQQIADTSWFYDDLDTAIEAANKSKRPLMIVFR